jgi:hypothetical protein
VSSPSPSCLPSNADGSAQQLRRVAPLSSYTVRRQPARSSVLAPTPAPQRPRGMSGSQGLWSRALRSAARFRVRPPTGARGSHVRELVPVGRLGTATIVSRTPAQQRRLHQLKACLSQRSQTAPKLRCASETAARPCPSQPASLLHQPCVAAPIVSHCRLTPRCSGRTPGEVAHLTSRLAPAIRLHPCCSPPGASPLNSYTVRRRGFCRDSRTVPGHPWSAQLPAVTATELARQHPDSSSRPEFGAENAASNRP